jgi:predicted RNA-binding protein YlqC (UPF0109 family)
MILKYLVRKLVENDDECKVFIKVVKGYRELEGDILEVKVEDIDQGKILVTMNIGKDS